MIAKITANEGIGGSNARGSIQTGFLSLIEFEIKMLIK